MDLEYSRKEKIVGLFLSLVAAALIAALIVIGRGKAWFEDYNTYYTTFNESYNLQPNAGVKLYKTNIGSVKKIILAGDKVRVKLVILEKYAARIRQDTLASVESPTFIGSEYIAIRPGSNAAAIIPEGGDIASKERKTVTDIMDEFEVKKTAKMVVQAAQDLSEVAHRLKDPEGPLFSLLTELGQILSHFEALFAGIQGGQGTIGELLTSKTMINKIFKQLDHLDTILAPLENAAQKTPSMMGRVNRNLDTVQAIGDDLQTNLHQIRIILDKVDKNMATVETFLENISRGSSDIPKITQSTLTGIQEIRSGVEQFDSVAKSLKKNIIIRRNLPPPPAGESLDADLRR